MNQNNNSSDLTRIFSGALSAITGVAKDVKDEVNCQIVKYLEKMDLVRREEFEVLQNMITEMRLEQEKMKNNSKKFRKN